MKTTIQKIVLVLIACVLPIFTSCQQEAGGLSGLSQARGKVEYNGKTVEGAQVTFHFKSPDGRSGIATTNAKGQFTLWTLKEDDGVFPGDYDVTVTKKVVIDQPTQEEMNAYEAKNGRPMALKYKDEVPAKYEDPKTSGIMINVPKGGNKNITISLAD